MVSEFRALLIGLLLVLGGCAQLSGVMVSGEPSGIQDTPKVTSYLEKAQRAESAGDIETARSHYEAMFEAGARSSRSLNHYAVFLRKQFELDEAEAVYQRALEFSPDDDVTHYNLGILYELYRGEFSKAKKHYSVYQQNATDPDPLVTGWIADLERRIAAGDS